MITLFIAPKKGRENMYALSARVMVLAVLNDQTKPIGAREIIAEIARRTKDKIKLTSISRVLRELVAQEYIKRAGSGSFSSGGPAPDLFTITAQGRQLHQETLVEIKEILDL